MIGQIENRYTSEMLRVKNSRSGKVFYYMRDCKGTYQRISRQAYNLRKGIADNVENLTIQCKGVLTRHFTTNVYFL